MSKIPNKKLNFGFTLLEILLVIGIIAILAGIVIMAINPGRQLAFARNAERKSDLKQINNALQQYYIDHREYPPTLLGDLTEICDTGSSASSSAITTFCDDALLINLSVLVPTYLTAIPRDPQATTTAHAGYQVKKHSSGKIGLSSTAELGQEIFINIPDEEVVVVDACGESGDVTDAGCWSVAVSSKTWGPTGVTTGIQNINNGAGNSSALIQREINNSESYPAAHYCSTLLEDNQAPGTWYLPAENELLAGWQALGSGGFPSSYYFSSTEDLGFPPGNVRVLFTGSGVMVNGSKGYQLPLRCLR